MSPVVQLPYQEWGEFIGLNELSYVTRYSRNDSTCLKSIEKRLTSIERRSDNFDRALMYVKQTRYQENTVPAHNNLSLPVDDYRSMISEELITAYRNAPLRIVFSSVS